MAFSAFLLIIGGLIGVGIGWYDTSNCPSSSCGYCERELKDCGKYLDSWKAGCFEEQEKLVEEIEKVEEFYKSQIKKIKEDYQSQIKIIEEENKECPAKLEWCERGLEKCKYYCEEYGGV